ncbi:MAG: pyridoxal-phosphate dependent enzyme [Bacteroidota bacterium]
MDKKPERLPPMHPFAASTIERSPLQQIIAPWLAQKQVQCWIKRDDLLHPTISGNKWRKLKYNLLQASSTTKGLLTFGGAYSNHLVATAAAAKLIGWPSTGIVRGEDDPDNQSLQYCRAQGMDLQFWSRSKYRSKGDASTQQELQQRYPFYLHLPEGGTNTLALKGAGEITQEILIQEPSTTHILVSAGTGGTAAGIVSTLPDTVKLEVISALKGDFLQKEIEALVPNLHSHWQLHTDFHFGGYARITEELCTLLNAFYREQGIPLDPIYTGKMLAAFRTLLELDYFSPGSKVVLVHTGGLQGLVGIAQRHGPVLDYSFSFPKE